MTLVCIILLCLSRGKQILPLYKDQFIDEVWRNELPFIVGTKTHAVGKIQSS
jgi:hypothetical protein